jgi:hypothetical protein
VRYKAADGEVIFRNTGTVSSSSSSSSNGPTADPYAIVSLATGATGLIVGLFLLGVLGIIAGLIGIVFGALSLGRIKKNPDKYTGKGLALAGLISGTVIAGLFVILLAILV